MRLKALAGQGDLPGHFPAGADSALGHSEPPLSISNLQVLSLQVT
jgi:hypothetical protein